MHINTIKHEELVFVFGSNRHGRHGKGAASTAKRFFGAKHGTGEGLTGQCYALPTKDGPYEVLPLDDIKSHVEVFIDTARTHADKQFMLTRIGTGNSGYSDAQMMGLFDVPDLPDNILLPGVWLRERKAELPLRLIVAGGRTFNDFDFLMQRCDRLLQNHRGPIEIVSGTALGADQLGERYCEFKAQTDERLSLTRFPANWDAFGKPAGFLRNSAMAWYATHLVAFWDGHSRGTKDMIDTATRERLTVRKAQYRR